MLCTKGKLWFLKGSYKDNIINGEMKRIKFLEIYAKRKKVSKRVLFVLTYHPSLNWFSHKIKDNLNILHMSWEPKIIFNKTCGFI